VGDRLFAGIVQHEAGRRVLDAEIWGRREPLTAPTLWGVLLRYLLITVKIIAAIHFEALRLHLKGLRFYSQPAARAVRGPLARGGPRAGHTAHKLALMAHSPAAFGELGRLAARAKSVPRAALAGDYEHRCMAAMSTIASRGRQANVLMHAAGYFKGSLDAAGRQELLHHIEDYRWGLVPLVVPLTLIRRYVRLFDVAYLREQVHLDPEPKQLMLRNHV